MKSNKRNRNKGRTLETYQNKLNKITLRYNKLFYQSKNLKEVYPTVLEEDSKFGKEMSGVFFFEKYPTLESFLEVNKLRKVSSK